VRRAGFTLCRVAEQEDRRGTRTWAADRADVVGMGDHDPVGIVVAQATARLSPKAQIKVLPAGHVPWFGNPDRVSELLSGFVLSGSDG
jgi:pimeloyl-ACP methyl ester carboxylesterase